MEISCDQKIIFELTDDVIGCDREEKQNVLEGVIALNLVVVTLDEI